MRSLPYFFLVVRAGLKLKNEKSGVKNGQKRSEKMTNQEFNKDKNDV